MTYKLQICAVIRLDRRGPRHRLRARGAALRVRRGRMGHVARPVERRRRRLQRGRHPDLEHGHVLPRGTDGHARARGLLAHLHAAALGGPHDRGGLPVQRARLHGQRGVGGVVRPVQLLQGGARGARARGGLHGREPVLRAAHDARGARQPHVHVRSCNRAPAAGAERRWLLGAHVSDDGAHYGAQRARRLLYHDGALAARRGLRRARRHHQDQLLDPHGRSLPHSEAGHDGAQDADQVWHADHPDHHRCRLPGHRSHRDRAADALCGHRHAHVRARLLQAEQLERAARVRRGDVLQGPRRRRRPARLLLAAHHHGTLCGRHGCNAQLAHGQALLQGAQVGRREQQGPHQGPHLGPAGGQQRAREREHGQPRCTSSTWPARGTTSLARPPPTSAPSASSCKVPELRILWWFVASIGSLVSPSNFAHVRGQRHRQLPDQRPVGEPPEH